MAFYQATSPRLSSPLNPSPKSFSPPLHPGRTQCTSPVGLDTSDTLPPSRERADVALASRSRATPASPFSRTSSFSRSPERSPVMCAIPHRGYARHVSPSSSPYMNMPLSPSLPLSSSPPASPSQSSESQNTLPLVPSCNSLRQGSPASFHSSQFQFQPRPLHSPHPIQSHLDISQSAPIQISPSRHPRTQSLVQQSFGNQVAPQGTSFYPGDPRNDPVSRNAESRTRGSLSPALPSGHSMVQDTPLVVNGDSTPLNEAPSRWWGGQRGWDDDWDHLSEGSQLCDPCGGHSFGYSGLDNTTAMTSVQPSYGNPLAFQEPFGRRGGPGGFLDEEIRASFDGMGPCFADPTTPSLPYAPLGANTVDSPLLPRAVPMPMPPRSTRSEICNDCFGYGGVGVGLPSAEAGFAMRRMSDNSARQYPFHVHIQRSTNTWIPDEMIPVHGQETGLDALGLQQLGERGRRFSDASLGSATSYASCMSGPLQSQSQSLLLSPSQSHTSACPSLPSLGIGIEEAEREELRSRTFWGRRSSGSILKREDKDSSRGVGGRKEDMQGFPSSQLVGLGPKAHEDSLNGERTTSVKSGGSLQRMDVGLKFSPPPTHETVKHGSLLFRVGLKHADAPEGQTQRDAYHRAEKCVSLAITSILSPPTITALSPVGEALVRARDSAKYIGQEIAPVLKETLSVSAEAFRFAPVAGLEEAAKMLLSVWEACQKVDTNRISCLRLAERCASLLYSVRCDFEGVGRGTNEALAEPVQRLCGALAQIRSFLETQLHRPFLKRYVRREEIARELEACNDAIADAASKFGISIQIRTYHAVCTAAIESRRIAQETQALLTMDYQIIQQHYAIMYGHRGQVFPGTLPPSGNSSDVAASSGSASTANPTNLAEGGGEESGREYLTPPPPYGPSLQQSPPTRAGPLPTTDDAMSMGPGQNVPTPPTLVLARSSEAPNLVVSASSIAMPTKPSFPEKFMTTVVKAKEFATPPVTPMNALNEVCRAQDSVDSAADEAALRGTLEGTLRARNDMAMVRRLQVARGEIPEAAETLRRMLGTGAEAVNAQETVTSGSGKNTELHEIFMRTGIAAMTRLASLNPKRPGGDRAGLEEGTGASVAAQLPSWTITRYEVTRRRKIGAGFFADVYLGRWRDRAVVIKVLAHGVSRETFVHHVELWAPLNHPNVVLLYGASSTVGEKPWFFVEEFGSGGSLVTSLNQAREEGMIVLGEGKTMCADLLRFMYEIAEGMAYLHGHGILHGDLRAANVMVNESGRCMLSDFGQCEIKAEAHRSCGQPESLPIRWRSPERLVRNDRPSVAADVYAFAICCVEILGMGDLPWMGLDDEQIRELVLDKDERPQIPMPIEYPEAAEVVLNLLTSCWVREPDRRLSFVSIATALQGVWRLGGHGRPQIRRISTPSNANKEEAVTPAESSPGEERYETASESMTTEVEDEDLEGMMDVPLTSSAPGLGNMTCPVAHASTGHAGMEALFQVLSKALEHKDKYTYDLSPTDKLNADARDEEKYRLTVGANHAFHSSLTLPLWSPTRVEIGAVGYLSKPKGEFVTLFNAIDPLQSADEQLRRLPSMYGYGKFGVQKREDGKRSVAQRGLDAISGFLTFKSRGERVHPERIARQYTFPLQPGKPSAYLCVEKTVHRYLDHLEAPTTWFQEHAGIIVEVYGPRYAVQREDLILVFGTLDAPDWALYVSVEHIDGRAQFNVFASREKGEPWGMYTTERAIKNGNAGSMQWVEAGQGTFASKVSSIGPTDSSHDVVGDTVMLAGLRFERGQQTPTVM